MGGLLTVYDGDWFFCSCSKCLLEIRTKYFFPKKFTDGRHDECIGEIETYLNERINKELKGEYIFQV